MYRIRKMTMMVAAPVLAAVLSVSQTLQAAEITEVAPLAALNQKAITLGKLLSNPLVPALLVSSIQHNLTVSYGRLRTDKPLFYVASTGSDTIPVLPCVEGIAQFSLNHPGSTRTSDGSVCLLPAEGRPNETYVVFDKTDGYAAFAISSAAAKEALQETAAARAATVTHSGEPLLRVNVTEETIMSWASVTSSANTNHTDVVSRISSLKATVSVSEAGISVSSNIKPKAGTTVEELCAALEKSLGASIKAFGASEGVSPECRFVPSHGTVSGRIVLSAAELKKAGKAFNQTVVEAMRPEEPQAKDKKE